MLFKINCLMLINHDLVMQICRFMGDSKLSVKNKAPIHLAYEARLGGPIQYRWMCPFEK